MDLVEGREFNLDSPNEWECLLVNRNEIIEVHLPSTNLECLSNLWAGFWVKQVVMLGNGDYVLLVKSLGCSDPDWTRYLSGQFNRKAGRIHLCNSKPCGTTEEYAMHVTRLRIFSVEAFDRPYMNAYMKRQLGKWQGEDLDDVEDDAIDVSKDKEEEEDVRKDLEKEAEKPEPLSKPLPAPAPAVAAGGDGDNQKKKGLKIGEEEKLKLRQRLDEARARMLKGTVGRGAGQEADAGFPHQEGRAASSKPDYTPSLAHTADLEPLGRPALEDAGLEETLKKMEEADRRKDQRRVKDRRRSPSRRDEKRKDEKEEGGFKRHYYKKLTRPIGPYGSRSSSTDSRESSRGQEEEESPEFTPPVGQDPYQVDWTERSPRREQSRGRQETEEGQKEKERTGWQKASETQEGTRPRGEPFQQWLTDEELQEQLWRGFGGGLPDVGGQETRRPLEETIERKARLSLTDAHQPCQVTVGPVLKSDHRKAGGGDSDEWGQNGQLFFNSCEAPTGISYGPSPGNARAVPIDRPTSSRQLGPFGRRVSRKIHESSSVSHRRFMVYGATPRAATTRGGDSCHSRGFASRSQTCQAGFEASAGRFLALAKRRQRTRRPEQRRSLGRCEHRDKRQG